MSGAWTYSPSGSPASTFGAAAFHVPVRDGSAWGRCASHTPLAQISTSPVPRRPILPTASFGSLGCFSAATTIVRPSLLLLRGKPSTLRYPSPPRVATRPAWAACPSRLLGVLPGLTSESTHLRAGFPLRCFQRFALPNIATEPAGRPTTPPPAVRPARSSRTRASPLQCSTRSKRIETELSHDVLNPARVPL